MKWKARTEELNERQYLHRARAQERSRVAYGARLRCLRGRTPRSLNACITSSRQWVRRLALRCATMSIAVDGQFARPGLVGLSVTVGPDMIAMATGDVNADRIASSSRAVFAP
jgi:hypothetical protein